MDLYGFIQTGGFKHDVAAAARCSASAWAPGR
jgi:hypothetical protein